MEECYVCICGGPPLGGGLRHGRGSPKREPSATKEPENIPIPGIESENKAHSADCQLDASAAFHSEGTPGITPCGEQQRARTTPSTERCMAAHNCISIGEAIEVRHATKVARLRGSAT